MMKILSRFQIDEFVQQVKTALAEEDESILAINGSAGSWARQHLTTPPSKVDMDWPEFYAYSDVVGDELIAQGILKVDRRRKRGLRHSPLRLRLSRKWYNENRKGEGK